MAFLDECNDYCHSHIVSKLRLADRQPPPPRSNFRSRQVMSSRLRSLDSKISFFAFADIITAVSGVLIFVALLLATDLGRPTSSSSQAANSEMERRLQEALAQQAEVDSQNHRLQELLATADTAPDLKNYRPT
jgi:hypothetical protein